MERIGYYASIPLCSSDRFGFPPQSIEAMAFGWLAAQRVSEIPLKVGNKSGLLGVTTKFKS